MSFFVALPREHFRNASLNTAFCSEGTAETAIKWVNELARLGMIRCDDLLIHSYNPVTERDEFIVRGKVDIFGGVHLFPLDDRARKRVAQKAYE